MNESRPLLIFTGGSGTGKTTMVRSLLERYPDFFTEVLSTTTRALRPDEVEGKEYSFITSDIYEQILADDGFMTTSRHLGASYGFQKRHIAAGNIMHSIPEVITKLREKLADSRKIIVIQLIVPESVQIERLQTSRSEGPEYYAKRMAEERARYVDLHADYVFTNQVPDDLLLIGHFIFNIVCRYLQGPSSH